MPESEPAKLTEIERELIAYFVNAAQAFGLPKSFGEIYGLYFSSKQPLALDHVVEKLRISKGSASQGIRFLRSINALNPAYLPGDRRDHFAPELSLRRIAEGFLKERIAPELIRGTDRLTTFQYNLREDDHLTYDRIQSIKTWSTKAKLLLPVVSKFLGTVSKKETPH